MMGGGRGPRQCPVKNKHTQHISKGGGGGGVGKGSLLLDMSTHSEVVVFSTVRYKHTRLVWRGRWCWQRVSTVGYEHTWLLQRRWWCSPSNMSVHSSCRCRGDGGVLWHYCMARWWCSPPSDMSAHSLCGGGGVGKESNTSTHSS
jgi:hypothetical protein